MWIWSLEAVVLPLEADSIIRPKAGEEKGTQSRLVRGESRLTLRPLSLRFVRKAKIKSFLKEQSNKVVRWVMCAVGKI